MAHWLTADLHFGERRLKALNRPFKSTKAMNDAIVANHNRVVKKKDIVWIVGDVVYHRAPEHLKEIARLNGRKILFRGNHCRRFTDEQLQPYFEEIVPEGEGRVLEIDGLKCWVTHYPTQGKPDMFNLVGHVHAAWKFQLNMMNVGVDVNHFRPVNALEIPKHFENVCKLYDRDVWAAYEDINSRHRDQRGAKTRYFKDKSK